MNDDVTVIVPAAGRGTRYGTSRNKVLEPLLGRPILRWTLEAAASAGAARIVVAAAPAEIDEVARIADGLPVMVAVTTGGPTRQRSVRNALDEAHTALIAVQDAARPLTTPEIYSRCLESVRTHRTGIAAMPVSDTLKRAEDGVARETVDRSGLWATQTPQCCLAEDLRRAYEVADRSGAEFTDEAALLQNAGVPVHLVNAAPTNIKVTTPDDLVLAESILRSRLPAPPAPRIGYGYDIHRFADGRRMVLGGVDFGLDYGLLGHSDADAVLHALMDALLGAAGLPDIGALFPNTDERWRGASSLDLLATVLDRVRCQGYRPSNVDITVIAEKPKIGPRSSEMKAAIAQALCLPVDAVGLKATTAEGLGDLGAGEGLAAHAVVMLVAGA